MKKGITALTVALLLSLCVTLVACSGSFNIARLDFGEDISNVEVMVKGVTKSGGGKDTKIQAVYDAVKDIVYEKYTPDKVNENISEYDYEICFYLDGSEGYYRMAVAMLQDGEGREFAQIHFSAENGFKHKGIKKGWYTLSDSYSATDFATMIERLFYTVMS